MCVSFEENVGSPPTENLFGFCCFERMRRTIFTPRLKTKQKRMGGDVGRTTRPRPKTEGANDQPRTEHCGSRTDHCGPKLHISMIHALSLGELAWIRGSTKIITSAVREQCPRNISSKGRPNVHNLPRRIYVARRLLAYSL